VRRPQVHFFQRVPMTDLVGDHREPENPNYGFLGMVRDHRLSAFANKARLRSAFELWAGLAGDAAAAAEVDAEETEEEPGPGCRCDDGAQAGGSGSDGSEEEERQQQQALRGVGRSGEVSGRRVEPEPPNELTWRCAEVPGCAPQGAIAFLT
jgi:hypothetical protein